MPSRKSRVLEQAQTYGVDQLSDADLLGLVLANDTASERMVERIRILLAEHEGLLNLMRGFPDQELTSVQATRLHALLEITRRIMRPSVKRYQIGSVDDAARLARPEMMLLDHEEMHLILLNNKNYVVGYIKNYKGTVNSSVLRGAEIFRPAILRNCPYLIVCHNHRSGNPEPSPEDLSITEQLVEAGKLLDIELLDHIIIGNPRFVSLKERLRW